MGQKAKSAARPVPLISDELIEYLDRLYPERCPNPASTGRQIWIEAGRRDVVRKLIAERAAQRKETNNPAK